MKGPKKTPIILALILPSFVTVFWLSNLQQFLELQYFSPELIQIFLNLDGGAVSCC